MSKPSQNLEQHWNGSLPPLSKILDPLMACPTCPNKFNTYPQLRAHQEEEQHFRLATTTTMPYRQVNYAARRNHQELPYDMPSPSSSSGSECDAIFTPAGSRAASPMGTGPEPSNPYRRHSHATNRRDSRRDSLLVRQPHGLNRVEKKDKEQASRKQQGACLIREERFLENYIGWRNDEQSSGNGTGSGTFARKTTIQNVHEKLSMHFLNKAWVEARLQGPVAFAEFQQECDNLINANEEPYYGTLLYDPEEEQCDHIDSKSRPCTVHGHPDWRECSRSRSAHIARQNIARFDREHGLTEMYANLRSGM